MGSLARHVLRAAPGWGKLGVVLNAEGWTDVRVLKKKLVDCAFVAAGDALARAAGVATCKPLQALPAPLPGHRPPKSFKMRKNLPRLFCVRRLHRFSPSFAIKQAAAGRSW